MACKMIPILIGIKDGAVMQLIGIKDAAVMQLIGIKDAGCCAADLRKYAGNSHSIIHGFFASK